MKVLYIDCGMGAAGDMLTAALLELTGEPERLTQRLNSIGIPGVEFKAEPSVKCGITGTHMRVLVGGEEEGEHTHSHHHEHDHEHHHEHEHHHHHHDHEHDHHHHHTSLHDIEHIVSHLDVSDKVKRDVIAVYSLIAEAESRAHGRPVTEIHFHEVGTMDAVADVTAVCLLMEELAPDRVIASPVHVGSGSVRCAHGILPVPAPTTAYILKDVPLYGGSIDGELCTPTGAALLRHFVSEFGQMPVMKPSAIGYGMGRKDFERANCVRAILGETGGGTQQMYELSCNVDDMTAEDIAFACERLFEGGANEVFTVAAGMKKSRPGTVITVICSDEKRQELIRLMFEHTSTLGVRDMPFERHVLERSIVTEETRFGSVRKKISSGYGVTREKYEHDDLKRIALE
ncbi:MAG: nickel pincer cofactor biosynthesis protein LarC, partial [Ruminococcus sp.]|nr:nickel pincer cofactor biosynthesis protein LarC [Ruminococcus sp.]